MISIDFQLSCLTQRSDKCRCLQAHIACCQHPPTTRFKDIFKNTTSLSLRLFLPGKSVKVTTQDIMKNWIFEIFGKVSQTRINSVLCCSKSTCSMTDVQILCHFTLLFEFVAKWHPFLMATLIGKPIGYAQLGTLGCNAPTCYLQCYPGLLQVFPHTRYGLGQSLMTLC